MPKYFVGAAKIAAALRERGFEKADEQAVYYLHRSGKLKSMRRFGRDLTAQEERLDSELQTLIAEENQEAPAA
jgi:hypothetical protein